VTSPAGPKLWHRPLARRVFGYGAGSVVAAVIGELAFAATFGWIHAGTTWATTAGFVGGAVPNYVLNRRWAWSDRRGRSRRTEVLLYVGVVTASFATSALVTHWSEDWAERLSPSQGWQTVMVAAAFLAVSGVFFVLKFVVYELVVFAPAKTTKGPAHATPLEVPAAQAVKS
jgi:putative flippase GtrA